MRQAKEKKTERKVGAIYFLAQTQPIARNYVPEC